MADKLHCDKTVHFDVPLHLPMMTAYTVYTDQSANTYISQWLYRVQHRPIPQDNNYYITFFCQLYWLIEQGLNLHQHSIGYTGDGFYRSEDPTNSI